MATSYLNMAQTTTAETLVRRAKTLCQLPSTSSGVNFLGSTDTDVSDELANIVNDAIRKVLDDCPILNISETTLTATSGDASTTLPTDLRHADILALEWAYDGYQAKAIRLVQKHEVAFLPDGIKDENCTQDPPNYCYLEWGTTGAKLFWLPRPATDREFKILYRATPLVITAAAVAVGTVSPQTIPFPDAMMELLIYKTAEKIARRNTGSSGTDWQVLKAEYESLLDEWAGQIASSPYAQRMGAMTFAGLPGTSFSNKLAGELTGYSIDTH